MGSPGRLTAKHAVRILSSLEAGPIQQTFQLVCSELLGPCGVEIFTFFEGDPSRVQRFGIEEEPTILKAPEADGGSNPGMARVSIEGRDSWRVLLPRVENDAPAGILQATFDQPLDSAGVELLRELTQTLSVAVRNARTFEATQRLTFTDDLTALYNSRFMALYLDQELKRCRRTRSSLSLLFMDLDGFKNVNDTHGHLAGSRTLFEVGAVLEQAVRDADVLIRYGGDEFVILFPETPLDGGLVIAEKIRELIGATKFLESQNIEARVSASIGIAAYPETADDVRGLISSADRAMYRAKTLGKNRVVVATPLTAPQKSPREA